MANNQHKRIINAHGQPMQSQMQPAITGEMVSRAILDLEVIDAAALVPIEFMVLLKIADKTRVTKSGIILSPSEVDKTLFASCRATVVSIGAECFKNSDGSPISNPPQIGDDVLIAKYPGIPFRDAEYNLYRFAHDKDVIAVVKAEKGAKA